MTTFTLIAKQDHLEKVASTRNATKALAEFVWNALDADATDVRVEFSVNVRGRVDAITVRDNGDGFSLTRAQQSFAQLGESWKRSSSRTARLGRAVHGKEGRGRLRFYSWAECADWTSSHQSDDGIETIAIAISAAALDKCDVSVVANGADATGTVVHLSNLRECLDHLRGDAAAKELSVLFASYLLRYHDTSIVYDGKPLDPATSISQSYEFPVETLIAPGRKVEDLALTVIEWKSLSEGRRIYLGAETGIILGSQAAHVTAPNFEFSAYPYCTYFQEIADANLLDLDELGDPAFVYVLENIRAKLSDYFRARQADRAGGLIDELKSVGAYPYEGDPKDEIERRERQVFDIATYAVSSYSKDFERAETAVKRMTLTMMREALRHNPKSITSILRAVVNLPKNRQNEFSDLLRKTELAHIISESSMISERVITLEILKKMVFDPKLLTSIKERGELDALIGEHTWIFGENFHISMVEAGLTRIMERVARELGESKSRRRVRQPDGRTGRVDTFLGREVPHGNELHREFLLIELKRPSLAAGRKELAQLEDYVRTIKSQRDFEGTSTTWTFFLVTGAVADEITSRVLQSDRPRGLVDFSDNHKVWVKTWAEIIREAEGRLRFVRDKLRIEVTNDDIDDRIAEMRASVLKEPTRRLAQNKPSFDQIGAHSSEGVSL